jgi:hypothetical protein
MTPQGVMDEEDGEEEEAKAWNKCLRAAPHEWIRYRRQVDSEYKRKENKEAEQAVDLVKDYLKMVDGRKKRQTESELCRLMCAWIVLKRRHERRQKRWKEMETSSYKKEPREDTQIEAATPTRKMKARTPESPTNPIEELRQTRSMTARTTFQAELRQHCLRQKKRILERELRSSKIKTHQAQYARVLAAATKKATVIRNNQQGVDAEWYSWHANNQPATATKASAQLEKKRITLQYKYRQTILVADRVMFEAQEAIEQPFPWFGEYEAEIADDNDNNHYFWHRGRPPEGDY